MTFILCSFCLSRVTYALSLYFYFCCFQVDARDWKFNSNTISLDEEVYTHLGYFFFVMVKFCHVTS